MIAISGWVWVTAVEIYRKTGVVQLWSFSVNRLKSLVDTSEGELWSSALSIMSRRHRQCWLASQHKIINKLHLLSRGRAALDPQKIFLQKTFNRDTAGMEHIRFSSHFHCLDRFLQKMNLQLSNDPWSLMLDSWSLRFPPQPELATLVSCSGITSIDFLIKFLRATLRAACFQW